MEVLLVVQRFPFHFRVGRRRPELYPSEKDAPLISSSLFIRLFFVLTSSSCYSSNLDSGCWIPETYITHLMEDPFGNHGALISPVHCIYIKNDSIVVKTYGGESSYVVAKKINGRTELVNMKYLFNLNYFDEEEVQQNKYYLFQTNQGCRSTFIYLEKAMIFIAG